MTTLQAGVSRADISPAKGTYLAGYGHPFRTCKSVRDPLTATVLVCDDGATRLALVSLDDPFASGAGAHAVLAGPRRHRPPPTRALHSHIHDTTWKIDKKSV